MSMGGDPIYRLPGLDEMEVQAAPRGEPQTLVGENAIRGQLEKRVAVLEDHLQKIGAWANIVTAQLNALRNTGAQAGMMNQMTSTAGHAFQQGISTATGYYRPGFKP